MRTIPKTDENADLGIVWNTEEVMHKGVVVCNHAQIPVMDDVMKFNEAFPNFIVSMSNGSSLRVQAQAVCRRMAKDDPSAQRAAILNILRGAKNLRRPTQIVTVHTFVLPLPDGEVMTWQGTEQAECIGALVDGGWDATAAQRIAAKMFAATK